MEDNDRGDSVCIQILANSIRTNLMTLPSLSSETCIYRVPEALRRVSESAYTPQVVSIGPFHRDNGSLGKMDVHKRRYLQTYLDWFPERQLESYLKALYRLEEKARQCYAERINLNSFQFVEMMLLDGFFIIVILIKCLLGRLDKDPDPIFAADWMINAILNDMILLENQLPFFVLDHLFNLAPVSNPFNMILHHAYPDLFNMTICLFGNYVKKNTTPVAIDRSKVKHILDLLRSICIPSSPVETTPYNRIYEVPHSATELNDAGVKFKAGIRESSCLFDVKFDRGCLEIQPLFIDNGTESFFRNIIALEQCHYPASAYVTSYTLFMDYLINTPKDADLLITHGIIKTCLGDRDEIPRFINNLSKYVVLNPKSSFFSGDYERIDKYCKKRRHKWMASLRRDYFNSPWTIVSVIAAVLLLLLTLTQTVCSIISL